MTTPEQPGELLAEHDRLYMQSIITRADAVIRRMILLSILMIVIAVFSLVGFFLVFDRLHDTRIALEREEVRTYTNRAVVCYELASVVGRSKLPSDCLAPELTKPLEGRRDPLFNPDHAPLTIATRTQAQTRDLLCAFFREASPSTQAFLADYERRLGARCDELPKA